VKGRALKENEVNAKSGKRGGFEKRRHRSGRLQLHKFNRSKIEGGTSDQHHQGLWEKRKGTGPSRDQ